MKQTPILILEEPAPQAPFLSRLWDTGADPLWSTRNEVLILGMAPQPSGALSAIWGRTFLSHLLLLLF